MALDPYSTAPPTLSGHAASGERDAMVHSVSNGDRAQQPWLRTSFAPDSLAHSPSDHRWGAPAQSGPTSNTHIATALEMSPPGKANGAESSRLQAAIRAATSTSIGSPGAAQHLHEELSRPLARVPRHHHMAPMVTD